MLLEALGVKLGINQGRNKETRNTEAQTESKRTQFSASWAIERTNSIPVARGQPAARDRARDLAHVA
jgi:hypothetical protein